MRRKGLFVYAMIAVFCFTLAGVVINCTTPEEQRDCVVMIGDSIFDYTGEITVALQGLSGQEYRTYYKSYAQMRGGTITDIETQYDNAIAAGPIRTIIMDGGGNDFLFGIGMTQQEIMDEIMDAYMQIFDKAKNDGVENIVVMGYYPADAEEAWAGPYQADMSAALVAAGASRGLKVVYVDPRLDDWFTSQSSADYTIWDGAHPTTEASERLAQLIWDAMVANDIEQGDACPASQTDDDVDGCN